MKKPKIVAVLALVASLFANPARAEEKKAEISKPYVQTTLTSKYATPQGVFADGKSRQDWISINPAPHLSLGIWENYSFKENAINERDFIGSASFKVGKDLTLSAGFQYWSYPTGTFGNFDSAETASLQYSGDITAKLKYTHLNKDSKTERGERAQFILSKPFQLLENLSLSPEVSTCYVDNYYGQNGFAHFTPGVSLGFSKGRFNAGAGVKKQLPIDSGIKDETYYEVSAGFQF